MQDGLLRQKKILQLIGAHKTRTAAYADCIGKLLYLRYFADKTQTEIGEELGISQVQVSRMEKKILKTMREHAKE